MSKQTTDTGGPVHPVQDFVAWRHHGMDLRDYFAAMAMQGMLSNSAAMMALTDGRKPCDVHSILAARSYMIADAMIAVRERALAAAEPGEPEGAEAERFDGGLT